MLKWLHLHRQRLEDGIQGVMPAILDHLVTNSHIDPLQRAYQEIQAAVPVQRVSKLVDWLCAQPAAVFWAFQEAIRQSGLPAASVESLVIADDEMTTLADLVKRLSLEERLRLTDGAVLKARQRLQKSYRSRDELVMNAGLAKGKTMPMDKILVNICLLSSENVKKAFEERSRTFSSDQDEDYVFSQILKSLPELLTLQEVFKAREEGEKDPRKVLATGGAGCGKSTCFTRKAPYEWAFERLWKQFALLFCLELRDKSVWKARTLAELLKLDRLNLTGDEQEMLCEFITNYPHQVVVICDGLDEGVVDKSSLLWSLLEGSYIGIPVTLHFVVATRPCEAASHLSQSDFYRGVEVVGFTQKDVALFAEKYLGEEGGIKLMSHLDKQPSIAGMMHTPLFCLMICDLFKEEQELPSRKTDIFEKIVVALMRLYAKSHEMKSQFRSMANAPAELRRLVIALGQMAFEGLKKKQMYFTGEELENAGVPLEVLELGLLTKSEITEFWTQEEYAFSHLTLQEFLAALYTSNDVLCTEPDMARLLETTSFSDGHLSTFWRFVAGLLKCDIAETFLGAYMAATDGNESQPVLFRYFAESHLGRSGSSSAAVALYLKKFGLRNWHPFRSPEADCAAICKAVGAHIQSGCISEAQIVRFPDARNTELLQSLRNCTTMKTLRFTTDGPAQHHAPSLSILLANNASTLVSLDLSDSRCGDEGLAEMAGGLKQCKLLVQLDLERVGLSEKSGTTLGNIVSCLPSLEVLSCTSNKLESSGLQALAAGFSPTSGLKILNLQSASLLSSSVPVLVQLISSLVSLEIMDIALNHFTPADQVLLNTANEQRTAFAFLSC